MKTMQAIVFQEEKNFDSLELKEAPYPKAQTGEAVVQIKAAALNHRDVWILQGLYPGIKVPMILGSDGSGIVREVGESVDRKWLNQPVIINPALDWGDNSRVQQPYFRILGLPDNGTQAAYVVAPAANLAEKPDHLSFEEAAAIPLGGLTGYRALFTRGGLQAGETVLLTGIGGGVAVLMMQMALAAGARVLITSGSPEKIAQAVNAGASGGANYKNENWAKEITALAGKDGVDLVVDSTGGKGLAELLSLINPGGRIVFFGATAGDPPSLPMRQCFWKQISLLGTTMGSPRDFCQMVRLFERCRIKPLVDGPYPFTQYRQAYLRMMSAEQFGKIVLVPEG